MGFGLVFICYILIFCLSFYQFTPPHCISKFRTLAFSGYFRFHVIFISSFCCLIISLRLKLGFQLCLRKINYLQNYCFIQTMLNSGIFLQHGFKNKMSNLFSLSALHNSNYGIMKISTHWLIMAQNQSLTIKLGKKYKWQWAKQMVIWSL